MVRLQNSFPLSVLIALFKPRVLRSCTFKGSLRLKGMTVAHRDFLQPALLHLQASLGVHAVYALVIDDFYGLAQRQPAP
jgi:hypothetical protein